MPALLAFKQWLLRPFKHKLPPLTDFLFARYIIRS
jgi:hypothetical protein